VRLDLELERENLSAIEANYESQKEKNKPNLNLSLSYLKQGRDLDAAGADAAVFDQQKESYMVGVQFSVPLNLGNMNDSKNGYEQLRRSQALSEQARQRGEAIQWRNAVDQAKALSEQLTIVRQLETIQKNKADLERSKYNNGRSTTYQVLNFEQDYVNTRNQRINLERDLRKFINSLSLFR
jgi:outer membrane protein TolC